MQRPRGVPNSSSNSGQSSAMDRQAAHQRLSHRAMRKERRRRSLRRIRAGASLMTMTIAVALIRIMMWISSLNRRSFTPSSSRGRCRSRLIMSSEQRVNCPLLMNRSRWRRTMLRGSGRKRLLSSLTSSTLSFAPTQMGSRKVLKCSFAMGA